VPAARNDVDATVLYVIDETVLFIDATTELTSVTASEGFRVSDARQNAVALYVLDEEVDSLRVFLSCVCQYR
jgi:hypothetical protein